MPSQTFMALAPMLRILACSPFPTVGVFELILQVHDHRPLLFLQANGPKAVMGKGS